MRELSFNDEKTLNNWVEEIMTFLNPDLIDLLIQKLQEVNGQTNVLSREN